MKKFYVTTNGGFTLLEIVTALGVLLILASIAVVSYSKFIDHARETVCQENLNALRDAVQVYISENVALPATLGELKPEHIKHGLDVAKKNANWRTKLAHAILDLNFPSEAHAIFLSYSDLREYGASAKIFQCPAHYSGGASYAINAEIAGINWDDIASDVILIVDSDSHTFSDPSEFEYRHGGREIALGITKGGSIIKLSRENAAVEDGDDDEDTVTICHKGKTTKTKSGSALEAHLAHGDTIGPCP